MSRVNLSPVPSPSNISKGRGEYILEGALSLQTSTSLSCRLMYGDNVFILTVLGMAKVGELWWKGPRFCQDRLICRFTYWDD